MNDLVQPWTLPVEWPVGVYFLYVALLFAGAIQWYLKRPRPPAETSPAATTRPDGPAPKPPQGSSPARQ
jgi:hypothetical protein